MISGRGRSSGPRTSRVCPHACAGHDLPAGGELTCSIAFRPTADQQASQLRRRVRPRGERAAWELAPRAGVTPLGCRGWRVRSVTCPADDPGGGHDGRAVRSRGDRRWPGRLRRSAYGASAGLKVAVVEKDKVGGTCLHRGCIPAKEFLETAAVYRHVAGAKEFGIEAGQPTVDFAVSQARKQKVVDGLWKGLAGLMKSRKITTYEGAGSLGAGHAVTVKGTDGVHDVAHGDQRDPGRRVGAAHHPRLRRRRADHDLRRGAHARPRPPEGRGHRRRRHRLRVRLHLRRPRRQGHDPRVPAQDPAGLRRRRGERRCARSFSKRGITIRTGTKVVGHEPTATGTKVLSREASRSRPTPSSCRSAAARSPTTSAWSARR